MQKNTNPSLTTAQLILKKEDRRLPVELCRIDRSQMLLEARGDAETMIEVLNLDPTMPANFVLHVNHIGQCGFTATVHASGCFLVATVQTRDRAFERFIQDLNQLAHEQRPTFVVEAINPTIACSQSRLVRRCAA